MQRIVLSSLVAVVVAGCGGADVSPQAPMPLSVGAAPAEPSSMSVSSLDSAAADLDRAERELGEALGEAPRSPGDAPRADAAPARPDVEKAPATRLDTDGCSVACRALASMQRSVTHLCELAGEADARCTGGRQRADDAVLRVRARCPACVAP